MTMDKPILFSGPMVRAILDGRKTQTRRIITPSNTYFNGSPWQKWAKIQLWDWVKAWVDKGPSPAGNPGPYLHLPWKSGDDQWEGSSHRIYPKLQIGDRLWVRETWGINDYRYGGKNPIPKVRPADLDKDHVVYAATETDDEICAEMPMRPSIHMPRWASRITLEVTGVKVERLQDISRGDVIGEGCPFANIARGPDPKDWFKSIWIGINGPGSWVANPWVVAISFSVVPHTTHSTRRA